MDRTRVTEEWNVQSERENGGGELRRKKGESGLREREKMRKKEPMERTRVTEEWNVQSERERWREEKVQADGETRARQLESQAWLSFRCALFSG